MFKFTTKSKEDVTEVKSEFSQTIILPPTVSTTKKLYNRFLGKYSLQKIEQQIDSLCDACGIGQGSVGSGVEHMKAERILQRLIYRSRVRDLQTSSIEKLIPCSIALVQYALYHISLEKSINVIGNYYYKKKFRRSENYYYNLVWRLTPEMSQRVLKSILLYFTVNQMWHVEHICVNMFYIVICCHVPLDEVLASIINAAKSSLSTDRNMSKDMIRVVQELLLRGAPNVRNIGLHEVTLGLINMFHEAIRAPEDSNQKYMQDGVEVCIRRALQRLPPYTLLEVIHKMIKEVLVYNPILTDLMILDYGSMIEYAITLYQFELYVDTLSKSFFGKVIETMQSERCVLCILGCRILERFLDRHENITEFIPKVYLHSMEFDITIGTYHSEDKAFLKANREIVHETIVKVLAQHGNNDMVLECIYGTLCICVVEIPCGFSAAFIVCIVMNIQELALKGTNLTKANCNHFHAVVASVISLICWLHQSPAFYKYMLGVIDRRSEQAPHLLAPLRSHYTYATHHTLFNKPDLFFDPWEMRYGLWKHFRLTKQNKEDDDDFGF